MDGDVNYPDMFMDGVGRHQESYHSYETFFKQAANGTLPHFSMIHPNDTWTDHPCNDVAKGERLTKDIYEALRAGDGWNKTLFLVVYDDAGAIYDHIIPPYAPPDDSPCNIDNKPGPGPPPTPSAAAAAAAAEYERPLRTGRHVGLGYETDARLLSAEERAVGMADRAPPMHNHNHNHNDHLNLQAGAGAGAGAGSGAGGGGDPPDLSNQTWVLLNTFAGDGRTSPMDTFVSFADSDAPPGQKQAELWMRVPYTDPKEAMPLKFVEEESARGPAGRVYMLQNMFGGSSKGWVTYEEDESGGGAQWFHASACSTAAAPTASCRVSG